jgi:hypothetical protein
MPLAAYFPMILTVVTPITLKFFITLTPAANVIKLFPPNYVAIGVTSVKIIGKYTTGGITYALKSFIILATRPNVIKVFTFVI